MFKKMASAMGGVESEKERKRRTGHALMVSRRSLAPVAVTELEDSEEVSHAEPDSTGTSEALWALEESIYTDAVVYPLCGERQGVSHVHGSSYFGTSVILCGNYFMQCSIILLLWHAVGRSTVLPGLFQHETPAVISHRWMFGTTPATKSSGVCKLKPWGDFDPSVLLSGRTSLMQAQYDGGPPLRGDAAFGNVVAAANPANARRLPVAGARGAAAAGAPSGEVPRSGNQADGSSSSFASHSGGAWAGSLVGTYWIDCRPDTVTYLTAWDLLDVDGDGIWTRQEAVALQEKMGRRFDNWMAYIRLGCRRGINPELETQTQNFTVMPRSVYVTQDYLFVLCGILNAHKCGTLEARQALRFVYPFIKDPIDRIDECEEMVGQTCKRILSADYRIYAIRHTQICGSEESKKSVSENVTIKTSEYSQVSHWNDTIRSPSYALFIIMILVVWMLALFAEMRGLLLMAELLVQFPGPPEGNDDSTDEADDEEADVHVSKRGVMTSSDGNTILWFPRKHRIYITAMVFIPRCLIVLILVKVGCAFLAASQTYQDAILNSVALTFVIDLDEMMFAGVLAYRRKKIVSSFDALKLDHSIVGHDCGVISPSLLYGMIIVSFSVCYVWIERAMPYGWIYKAEALACFCDVQGPSCTLFWEMQAVMGQANSSIQVSDFYNTRWLPQLPGWV